MALKLDSRIRDRKYIFDCFTADKATKYIGQECYMSDYIHMFYDVDEVIFSTLAGIDDKGRFITDFYGKHGYTFCLPPEFVKRVKAKKWRPYTLVEFQEKFHIGLPITFRKKGEKVDNWCSVLGGYWDHQVGNEVITYIYIGPVQYTLNELFEDYEWQSHYTEDFQPFGVEE